ncbi:unnamed protein product [Nyctereutes procyonoides]|uniref:(raccoon dog) hypothetical protein n=1 Tax=Nyctereutes procyonoides TaxID=34880 RepID=A0A811Z9W9_NYCPR|nr:unnamed protein product [Nyctereutes procyonoides]
MVETKTPNTGGTPVPRAGGAHHWETGGARGPAPFPRSLPYTQTQTLATRSPIRLQPNPVPSGSGGTNREQTRPCRAAGLPGPPPEVRQHIRVPGTRTGRAAIWPGPFPVGFPLHRAPGRGQGHSPSPKAQKARVSHGWGTATQVPRSQDPRYQWCAPRAHRRWCPGKAKFLAAGGVGRRWAPGPREQSRPQATRTDGRMDGCTRVSRSALCRQGVGAGGKPAGVLPPPTPCSKNESGAASAGGATTTAPPSLVPKYFPPSRSSWDRKIPRAAGPALPATARPPSLSLTLCLMGPDSPQRLPGPGPEPAANLGRPAKCRLTTSPPNPLPQPQHSDRNDRPHGRPSETGTWVEARAGRWQVGGPPLPTRGWGGGGTQAQEGVSK